MPSRRDQIQSYQFAVQRVVSALVAREADPAQTPLRRLVGAGFGSIMVAIIALAAVGIFGLVTGRSGAGWRDGNAVIIERETGATYVYRDGRLIPTVNFTSALLLQGSPKTVTVPRAQLASEPRVPMVGIPNAPGSLPDPRRLLTGPWTLCTSSTQTTSGGLGATTAMLVGSPSAGGRSLGPNEALLVKLPNADTLYLVWRAYRYRIIFPNVVLPALAMDTAPRITVGAAWLNALPQGQNMQPLTQANRGRAFTEIPDLPDAKVGQIVVVETAGEKIYYLIGTDELRRISEVDALVALADSNTRRAYDGNSPVPRPLSVAAVNSVDRAPEVPPSVDQAPDKPPQLAQLSRGDASFCATSTDAGGVREVIVDATPPVGRGVPTVQRTTGGVPLVDLTMVDAGRGAIVEAMASPDATSGTLVLVTDLGIRYVVPSREALAALGYGTAQPVRLPALLVARLPEGPALDPTAAAQPIEPTG